MAPTPRQQTSELWLLDWLRSHPAIKRAVLKNETDVGFNVEVLVVPSRRLAKLFRAAAEKELRADQDDLEDGRRRLVLRLLEEQLPNGPRVLDVELYGAEATSEVPEDFSTADGFLNIPVAFYVTFKMKKKSAPTKKSKSGGVGRKSKSGGQRYVVPFDSEKEPGHPTWQPNPGFPDAAPMLRYVKTLLRPQRPTLREIANKLNVKGYTTLKKRVFTEQNVDRVVVAAELLLGNRDPAFRN